MTPRPGPPVPLLVAIGLLGTLTIHMILPALPALALAFRVDYSTAQLLLSLFLIAFAASQIFVGPLADAYGRRPVLLAGLGCYAATSLGCALAPTIEVLIVLRVLQGASAAVGVVVARAIVRDLRTGPEAARLLGLMAVGIALGPMLAPAAGGAVHAGFGWAGIFALLAILGALVLALSLPLVAETGTPRGGPLRLGGILRDFGSLMRNRIFRLHAWSVICNTCFFYAFVVGAPFVATVQLGLDPVGYGVWFGLVGLGYIGGNLASSYLVMRVSQPGMVLVATLSGAGITAAMVAAFAAGAGSVPVLFGGMAAATFVSGFIMPNSLAGVLGADASRGGTAAGLIGFLQFVVAAFYSTLATRLMEQGDPAVTLTLLMWLALTLGLGGALPLWRRR